MGVPGIPPAPAGPGGPGGPGGQPGPADEILVAFAEPADQRRLTVLVRIILAIPQLVVLYVLGIAAEVVAVICWFAALVTGRLPAGLAEFQVGYLRWTTRVYAYLFLLTDAYPPFEFEESAYPVRMRAEPGPLNRLAVLFRIILVIPALIVSVLLGYGVSFLVMFVAWLIVLIAGRMPRPLHEALAAVVRYEVRVHGYFLMLTARYPGGLFGDPAFPGAPAAPDWGEPAPDQPAPYQPAPGQPGAAQPEFGQYGYGQPGTGWGQPGTGWGQPGTGWGQPEASPPAPGYGQPAPGYGPPAPAEAGYPAAGFAGPPAPVRWLGGNQPWQLVLSRPAKRLVALFLVLGVLLVVGYTALIAGLAVVSGNSTVARANAALSVEGTFATLSATLSTFDSKVAACQGKLSCVNTVDGQMSQAFSTFAQGINGISMPTSASAAAAGRVRSDASQASAGFRRLSAVTSAAQYQQVVASTGLEGLLRRFDRDYLALGTTLGVHPG
jgi:hypothetical protein